MNEPSVELLNVFVDVKIDVCVDFQAYDVTSRNYKKQLKVSGTTIFLAIATKDNVARAIQLNTFNSPYQKSCQWGVISFHLLLRSPVLAQ